MGEGGCRGAFGGVHLRNSWNPPGIAISTVMVNLLCDFTVELLGGLCQQLCGSRRSLRGSTARAAILCLSNSSRRSRRKSAPFPKVLGINKVEQMAETKLCIFPGVKKKNSPPAGHLGDGNHQSKNPQGFPFAWQDVSRKECGKAPALYLCTERIES